MVIRVNDEFGDLDRHKPVGNPYHGKIENLVLTLETTGEKIPWPAGSGSGINLVQFPHVLPVETPEDDLRAGLRYDNYALLQNCVNYPLVGGIGWVYSPTKDVAWQIRAFSLRFSKVVLTVYNLMREGDGIVIEVPHNRLGTTDYLPYGNDALWGKGLNNPVAFSRDGERAAITVLSSTTTNGVSDVLGVVEVVASGGTSTEPPSFTSVVVVSEEEITTYNTVRDHSYTSSTEDHQGLITRTGRPAVTTTTLTYSEYVTDRRTVQVTDTRRICGAIYLKSSEGHESLALLDTKNRYTTRDEAVYKSGGGTATRVTVTGQGSVETLANISRDVFVLDYTHTEFSFGVDGGPRYNVAKGTYEMKEASWSVELEALAGDVLLGPYTIKNTPNFTPPTGVGSSSYTTFRYGVPGGSSYEVVRLSNNCLGLVIDSMYDDAGVLIGKGLVAAVSAAGIDVLNPPKFIADDKELVGHCHPITGEFVYGKGSGFV